MKDTEKPCGYRNINFKLNILNYVVAVLANPIRFNSNCRSVLDWLYGKGILHIFSLDNQEGDIKLVKQYWEKKAGTSYDSLPIEDYKAPSIWDYEMLANKLVQWEKVHELTALYCGAGYGRCGTMLAAFALYQTFWVLYKQDVIKLFAPYFYLFTLKEESLTEIISVALDQNITNKRARCTAKVKQAIEYVRKEDAAAANKHNGQSVEFTAQVKSLIAYEKFLVVKFGLTAFKEHGYEAGIWFAGKLLCNNQELRRTFINTLGARARRDNSLEVFYHQINEVLSTPPFDAILVNKTLMHGFKESDKVIIVFNYALAVLDVNILNLHSDCFSQCHIGNCSGNPAIAVIEWVESNKPKVRNSSLNKWINGCW